MRWQLLWRFLHETIRTFFCKVCGIRDLTFFSASSEKNLVFIHLFLLTLQLDFLRERALRSSWQVRRKSRKGWWVRGLGKSCILSFFGTSIIFFWKSLLVSGEEIERRLDRGKFPAGLQWSFSSLWSSLNYSNYACNFQLRHWFFFVLLSPALRVSMTFSHSLINPSALSVSLSYNNYYEYIK